ncbi:MAG: hypothetical protein LBT97_00415, partial [Planctomycetota bacterium]|nr:hypothetical protein [Planctomycetota bacterium]
YCKVGGIARQDEKSTHWSVSSNIFGGNRAVVGPIFSKSPLSNPLFFLRVVFGYGRFREFAPDVFIEL